MNYRIENNELIIEIDKSIYNSDILHKCFYWYGEKYDVDISDEGFVFKVKVIQKDKKIEFEDLTEIISKIKKDLIDFKLRDIVSKETKTIRELIVAKAFAYYDLNENPSTDVSDPLGFNPDK